MLETASSKEKENLFHKAANRIFCLGKYCPLCERQRENCYWSLPRAIFWRNSCRKAEHTVMHRSSLRQGVLPTCPGEHSQGTGVLVQPSAGCPKHGPERHKHCIYSTLNASGEQSPPKPQEAPWCAGDSCLNQRWDPAAAPNTAHNKCKQRDPTAQEQAQWG